MYNQCISRLVLFSEKWDSDYLFLKSGRDLIVSENKRLMRHILNREY